MSTELSIQLGKFNDKQKLFIWLYFPYDIDDIDKTLDILISIGKKYGINDNILFRKVIEYLNIKNYNKDKIIETLYKYNFITIDNLKNTIDMIDEICNSLINKLNTPILNKLLDLTQLYKCYGNCDHSGYPTIDEELGRPQIGWRVCYYENCFNEFITGDALREHLIKLDKYKYGFHVYHEEAVKAKQLTPEKVIEENITKCPSIVCDKSHYDFTPEELCEHLTLLGIPPFWKQGLKITQKKKLHNIFDKIYISNECIICFDENTKPSVLFQPCNHCCICVNCYQKTNKCPMCRKDILNVIPI